MGEKMRKSGIGIAGEISWGAHFCQFYQTKEDLVNILIPYFKAGLENNEFCLWVISEQLDKEEAKEALNTYIPDINFYLENGQIEILSYTYRHVEEDPHMIFNHLIEKINKALASGYDGLRYSGNDFFDHEELLGSIIGKYPMISLCTYPIDKFSATDVLDIVANHQFALTKKEGKWERIECSCQKNNKECKQVEAELSVSEERFSALVTASSVIVYRVSPDWSEMRYLYGRGFLANTESPSRTWLQEYVPLEDQPHVMAVINEAMRTKSIYELEHRVRLADGSLGWIFSRAVPLLDANGEIVEWFGAASDITKSKEAEAKLKATLDNLDNLVKDRTEELQKAYDSLKQSEKSLAEAQEIAHLGNWELDFASNEFHWSDEMYRIFGLKPQKSKINYDTFLNYVHPDDRKHIDNAAKEALKGKPSDINFRIILSNEKERIVHSKSEIVFDEKENPVRVIGTTQDITEHKKAEEKIQNLANVVESSTEAIITKSFDGIITSWNKGAEYVYGYSAEEILDKPISILEPSILTGETEKLSQMVKRGEKIQQYETLRLRKDGKVINVSLTIFPVFDNQGKITAASIIATDITRRKEAEEKLRESEEKYRNIVEISNEGIYLVDDEAKIIYANKIMETSGYTLEELIGRPIWDFISEESMPIAKRSFEKRRQGINDSYELKLMRKDGSFIWGLISAKSLFNKEGKFVGYLGMLTDITERKKAEEVLANIETARKKEIHHRIKNNLQVISSLLDLQAEQFKNRECIGNSEVLEAFRESQDRVISMALIHEELYKGGGFETLNFSPYIQELTNTLFQTYRLGNTDISLSMDLEENLLFDIDTAVPLGIIINELVSNSLKHAFPDRKKGEIQIKLHREEFTELESKDWESTSPAFILTISDNGVGIPENLNIEDLDSLGFQLVTSLVDQLDGKFELKSKNGTEFTMKFRVAEKDNLTQIGLKS